MTQQVLLPYVLALVMNERNELLLEYRTNTEWFANQYGLVGGKIDGNESGLYALSRELSEEIGVSVNENDIEFAHVMHFMGEDVPCVAFFYIVRTWHGTISNAEQDKHGHLQWFSVDKIPENMIPRHKKAVELIARGIRYSEDNWK